MGTSVSTAMFGLGLAVGVAVDVWRAERAEKKMDLVLRRDPTWSPPAYAERYESWESFLQASRCTRRKCDQVSYWDIKPGPSARYEVKLMVLHGSGESTGMSVTIYPRERKAVFDWIAEH